MMVKCCGIPLKPKYGLNGAPSLLLLVKQDGNYNCNKSFGIPQHSTIIRYGSEGSSRVITREPAQQVVDLGPRRRIQRCAGNTLGVMGNRAALVQDILAHRETDALLLLVADERKMRVEEIMSGIP